MHSLEYWQLLRNINQTPHPLANLANEMRILCKYEPSSLSTGSMLNKLKENIPFLPLVECCFNVCCIFPVFVPFASVFSSRNQTFPFVPLHGASAFIHSPSHTHTHTHNQLRALGLHTRTVWCVHWLAALFVCSRPRALFLCLSCGDLCTFLFTCLFLPSVEWKSLNGFWIAVSGCPGVHFNVLLLLLLL